MATFTEDFTGSAGALTTGYTAVAGGAISRNGSGEGTGSDAEERGVFRTNESYANDQTVTWTKRSISGAVDGALLRGSGSGATYNCYQGYVASVASWGIQRITSGASTTLDSGAAGLDHALNDVFEFSVSGTVLTLKRNGSTLGSYDTNPDGTKYSSGSPGFYTYSQPLVDNVIFADASAPEAALSGSASTSGHGTAAPGTSIGL
jgi:hypothetical protein